MRGARVDAQRKAAEGLDMQMIMVAVILLVLALLLIDVTGSARR
jgi:hypothetical protein